MHKTLEFKPRHQGARKKTLASGALQIKEETTYGYAASADGTKIFYSSEGEGLPLVFCYGLVCSSLHWTYQIEFFKKSYQTIWFDYRGHNNSEKPDQTSHLTIEFLALDLLAVLDALKIDQCVIAGHSMGVNVALEFCRLNPSRVKGLILANGTPHRPLDDVLGSAILARFIPQALRMYQKAPDWFNFFWKLQKNNPILRALISWGGFNTHLTASEDIRQYIDEVTHTQPEVFLYLLNAYQHFDAITWLHEVKAPALVIAGESDLVTPVDRQELMYQLLPQAFLEKLKHGSHCAQLDLPELVNIKMLQFLENIGYVSKSIAKVKDLTKL